ncbi:UPF0182 family protein [Tessaracoccus coleopterorum]|uniref:UPF0182 family protein n=1 Tax=Tessaracoccus coleopterorum TaxID=2714950 RepID=UPI0022B232C5|nr:UPF0182 family protein [Tessaracoccus coleopterorum]
MSAEDLDAPPRRSPLLWTVLVVGGLIIATIIASRVATDYLWFRSIDFQAVFTTRLAAQIGLLVGFALVMFAIVFVSMVIAYRLRPKVRRANLDSEFLVQMRDVLDERSRFLMAVPSLIVALLAGLTALGQADMFLAWLHRTPFGQSDPYFGVDASFYVFTLPWLQFVTGFLLFAVVLGGIGALSVHFLTGALNASALRGKGSTSASVPAQRQLSITLGIAILLFGVRVVLDRYALNITPSTLFTGMGYTDFQTRMPVTAIVAAICVICALACFYNAWRVRWSVPAASIALLVVSMLILSSLYPGWSRASASPR